MVLSDRFHLQAPGQLCRGLCHHSLASHLPSPRVAQGRCILAGLLLKLCGNPPNPVLLLLGQDCSGLLRPLG